ncbi:helix-turn-helix transcriptional regulator [Dyadobacter tibetensis]|uniref:helix-turn-helix transcriptional regulator n=1 Tax=Dyadobacter tibetensis TaxID=1211851 RepID=UPI00046EBE50|nr:YafY family protein [Dyadobacter tibetensis]
MNRFDRITAILIQLQSKKIVKAQELADRFDISLRTVYRDMNSLAEAGVPLVSEAGIGYSLLEGYRLPPVMFTREEARSFIAAEKLVEKFTDSAIGDNYRSAMFKIKAVLKGQEKDMIENLAEHVMVNNFQEPKHSQKTSFLDPILESIHEKKVLQIIYWAISTDVSTERKIEPVGIYHENNRWYTIAYCHLRGEYRNFRADRIQQAKATDQHFDLQHAPLAEFLKRHSMSGNKLTKVVLQVEKHVANYIMDRKYYYGFISEQLIADKFQMTFLTPDIKEFGRWYLMLGMNATIIEPEELKEQVRLVLGQIEARL